MSRAWQNCMSCRTPVFRLLEQLSNYSTCTSSNSWAIFTSHYFPAWQPIHPTTPWQTVQGTVLSLRSSLRLIVWGTWQRGTLENGERGWIRKQPNQNCQLMPLKTLNSSIKGFIGLQGFHCAIQVLEGAYCKLLSLGESRLCCLQDIYHPGLQKFKLNTVR